MQSEMTNATQELNLQQTKQVKKDSLCWTRQAKHYNRLILLSSPIQSSEHNSNQKDAS
jgi:hypothetical protein